jgi:two-component system, LuxR family, response regulator FixJ
MSADDPTVFVIDDDVELCSALSWVLQAEGLNVQVYYSAEDFEANFDPRRIGCLVLDVRMRGLSGLELQARLKARDSHLPIIILTGHADVAMAVRALKAGAQAFLEKPVNDQLLISHVRQALRLDAQRVARREKRDAARRLLARLTPREKQVKDLVIRGWPNKQIAAFLKICEKTVEVHRKHVMHKLGVQSVADLVRLCLEAEEPDEPEQNGLAPTAP